MSWRDDLRPASFRGVPFEVTSFGERGGMRGAHHVYPGRDQGWVEQLGLQDDRISLDAFVIGDDYRDRRDALREALKEPGAGELIHPRLGSLTVTVDPGTGWSISESYQRGRTARFSLSFVIAPTDGTLPAGKEDGAAATSLAADAVEASALDNLATALDLSGIEVLATDFSDAVASVFSEIDRVTSIVRQAGDLPGQIATLALAPIAELSRRANDLIGLRDGLGSVSLLFDAIAGNVGGRLRTAFDLGTPGARPAAVPPDAGNDDAVLAESAAAAAAALLDRARTASAVPAFAANRDALDQAMDLALLSELARATVRRTFEGYAAAIAAMKALDARIEAMLASGLSDQLIANLTDLRAAARDALLVAAANAIPIAHRDLGESLPMLAANWYLAGTIRDEADLIARNQVAHPLWAPAQIAARIGGADA